MSCFFLFSDKKAPAFLQWAGSCGILKASCSQGGIFVDLSPRAFRRTKYTCYYTYLAMSAIFVLPPMLFTAFHRIYGISYTLLGTLVLINFCVQMGVDLFFSFFPRALPTRVIVRVMPFLTTLGLLLYALLPMLFPHAAYGGLVAGTAVFSLASGLNEVVLSPTVAALPSKDPKRDMSTLHSLYAWGVLLVVVLTSLFLRFIGDDYWHFLVFFFALLPLGSGVLFAVSPLPDYPDGKAEGERAGRRHFGLFLCVLCLFFGSSAENGMTNWISAYMETALGIPKSIGDVLGLALFALLLGLTRTAYGKWGKSISPIIAIGMGGAAVCYLAAALSPLPAVAVVACVLTGLCTSMLWPGMLIYMEEKIPAAGVAAYALMAAGGDLGASFASQTMGAITDAVTAAPWARDLAASLGMGADALGMKAAMLFGAAMPIIGLCLFLFLLRYFKKQGKSNQL